MQVTVVGAGYVGLVTGVCLADFGHNVDLIDIDAGRIDRLRQGISPIFEPGIDRLIRHNIDADRLHFSLDLAGSAKRASVIFIAVSTPSSDAGDADLTYLNTAVDQVAAALGGQVSDTPTVLVVKSTVPVGTCASVRQRLAAAGVDEQTCIVVSNPEFLREGSAIGDCLNPERIVIGSSHAVGFDRMRALYHSYVAREIPFVEVALEAAEHIKYASNAFLAVKISFINELALLCEKTDTDVLEVARGMGLDSRIGPSFLAPGPGFGGSCFPKDIRALSAVGKKNGVELKLLTAVETVNQRQKQHIVTMVLDRLNGIQSPVVAVFGLAFKANTDDMRDSPSLDILPPLVAQGITVRAYDLVAADNARKLLGSDIQYCNSPIETVAGADLILILTEWNEFYDMDLMQLRAQMKTPVIVDARRVVDPIAATAAGFRYYGIGRA
ncbi:UDP-glucose/GDP-mannose dehydrogenase family protein [bacterium]|nr:UDP-glucose/GDP-mannose dehydrogenase family protein [bacterium]